MFVRDHTRPTLHLAMGLNPDEYDYRVFDITTEISKQVFPLSLDTNSETFRAGLRRLVECSEGYAKAKAQGGAIGLVKRARWALTAVGAFAKLYLHPVHRHDLPQQMRVAPAW
jgi:magnesium-protoporphyrin IX monomethyl ester (oxidative) cyclase